MPRESLFVVWYVSTMEDNNQRPYCFARYHVEMLIPLLLSDAPQVCDGTPLVL